MGSADVRAYSRNKRGVAGSLIWINFDRHALLNVFRKARGRFLASKDEIRPQFRTDETAALDQTAIFSSALTRTSGGGAGATIDQLDNMKGVNRTRSLHPDGPPRTPGCGGLETRHGCGGGPGGPFIRTDRNQLPGGDLKTGAGGPSVLYIGPENRSGRTQNRGRRFYPRGRGNIVFPDHLWDLRHRFSP